MQAAGRTLRRVLDTAYLAGGALAALFLIAILVLIVLQMLARWFGFVFPGATDYAGYCMAAASFLAFANALGRGAHIRVSILLNALEGKRQLWLEIWCFGVGTVISTYFAWYAVKTARISYRFDEISQGLDATPIWIPQLAMCAGTILLAIAFWDHLLRLILTGRHGIVSDSVDQSHGE